MTGFGCSLGSGGSFCGLLAIIRSGCGLRLVSLAANRSNNSHISNAAAITPAPMPTPNFETALTLRSRSSCLFAAMFQSPFQFRIVQRQQRPLLQLSEERRQPDSADANGRRHIEPVQVETGHPEQIH